ncbi:hypothetical protein D3C85_1888920 [compost metagenome]
MFSQRPQRAEQGQIHQHHPDPKAVDVPSQHQNRQDLGRRKGDHGQSFDRLAPPQQ